MLPVISMVKTLASHLVLIPLVAIALIACTGSADLEVRVKLLESSQNETAAQLRRVAAELDSSNKTQLIGVLDLIDRAGLHQMNEDLQKNIQVNPRYLGTVRNLRRAVVGTSWPVPLKGKAELLKEALTEGERSLSGTDIVAIREAIFKVHLAYHPLVDTGWKIIAGEPIQ